MSMDLSTVLPTFIVTLREGFEATLIVGIVFTCLQKAKKQEYYSWIYVGVITGIVASILVGLFLWEGLATIESSSYLYAPFLKQLFKTLLVIIAITMLSWMLIWMSKQAKSIQSEVQNNIQTVLDSDRNSSFGIFLLVFIAVLREGFETVFFINAQVQDNFFGSCLGAMAGLSLAVIMGWGLFYWGIKINIRLFFQVMGIFLLLIVSGLVIGGLKNLDYAIAILSQINSHYEYLCFSHQSCLLGFSIWDMSKILPDSQFPGILFKT